MEAQAPVRGSRPVVALPAGFKARYAKLHPAGQMVGLMLWLPLAFVIVFSLCYIGGMHAPAPHNVPIGVVGADPASEQFAGDLHASSHGAMSGRAYPGLDGAATTDLREGKVAALFVPGKPGLPAQVLVASANGEQLSNFAQQALGPVAAAAAEKTTLTITDIAPLPAHDAGGTVAFFVTLVGTIGGYLVGVFCGMLGGPLRRWVRWAVVVASTFVFALASSVVSGPILGAVTGHFWQMWLILWATGAAAGLVTDALGYFFGRFVVIPALVVFVFVNVPASGGTYPVQFVPGIFRWLHHVVIGGYDVPLMRRAVYGVGPSAWQGVAGLAVYAAIGIALAWAGPYYVGWRRRRRAQLGLSPAGMMGEASHQLMMMAAAHGAAQQQAEAELAAGEVSELEAEIEVSRSPYGDPR